MHVVWLNDSATPDGGAERYVYRTARLLEPLGVRSTLLYHPSSRISAEFASTFALFPRVDLPLQLRQMAPDAVFVHQVQDRPSIPYPKLAFLHDHRPFCLRESKITTLGGRSCDRRAGARCYPCLGFLYRDGQRHWRLRGLTELRRRLDWYRQFDRLVAGSAYTGEEAARHGLDEGRIRAIPLYAEAGPLGEEPVPGRILFAGALVRGKGLDLLLQALAQVSRPWTLEVAGQGAQAAEYRQMVHDLGWRDRVSFLGQVEDMAAAYRRCQLLAFPTRMETFGLVGLEALAQARPVVAFAVGGVREWLRPGQNGWGAPPMEVPALAAALQAALEDPAECRRRGLAGLRQVREEFHPDRHVGQLHQVLCEVAGCRASR